MYLRLLGGHVSLRATAARALEIENGLCVWGELRIGQVTVSEPPLEPRKLHVGEA